MEQTRLYDRPSQDDFPKMSVGEPAPVIQNSSLNSSTSFAEALGQRSREVREEEALRDAFFKFTDGKFGEFIDEVGRGATLYQLFGIMDDQSARILELEEELKKVEKSRKEKDASLNRDAQRLERAALKLSERISNAPQSNVSTTQSMLAFARRADPDSSATTEIKEALAKALEQRKIHEDRVGQYGTFNANATLVLETAFRDKSIDSAATSRAIEILLERHRDALSAQHLTPHVDGEEEDDWDAPSDGEASL
jgi:hypothetical protein